MGINHPPPSIGVLNYYTANQGASNFAVYVKVVKRLSEVVWVRVSMRFVPSSSEVLCWLRAQQNSYS